MAKSLAEYGLFTGASPHHTLQFLATGVVQEPPCPVLHFLTLFLFLSSMNLFSFYPVPSRSKNAG